MNWIRKPSFMNSQVHKAVVKDGSLTVLISVDDRQLHLSISHPRRYPSWDEIYDARYRFMPDEMSVIMYLPPKSEYVNLHSNTFHLWEDKS